MDWKKILIGGCIYTLVIFSGYGIPLFMGFLRHHCASLIAFSKTEGAVWRYAVRGLGFWTSH